MKLFPSFVLFFLMTNICRPVLADPGESARLTVRTVPPSTVSIDGKVVGKSPIDHLAITPGRHLIGYEDKSKGSQYEFEFRFKPGKHITCTYDFARAESSCGEQGPEGAGDLGFLELVSDPPSEVFIDGRLVGPTPISRHEIESGPHIVEFRHANYPSITKNIDVKAKGKMKVRVLFETAVEPTAKPTQIEGTESK
jgi:hypothetical protein